MSNYLDNNHLPPVMDREALKEPYNPRDNVFYTVRSYKSDDVRNIKFGYLKKDISLFVEESPKTDNNNENLKSISSRKNMFNKINTTTTVDHILKSKHCKRCSKIVYEAEKVSTAGAVWHKSCFRCFTCLKSLQLGQISERCNEIYCNSCYAKDYGPKGYGHGVNTITLA